MDSLASLHRPKLRMWAHDIVLVPIFLHCIKTIVQPRAKCSMFDMQWIPAKPTGVSAVCYCSFMYLRTSSSFSHWALPDLSDAFRAGENEILTSPYFMSPAQHARLTCYHYCLFVQHNNNTSLFMYTHCM